MWMCFNDGFISVVAYEGRPGELLVRARRREILEELFPSIPIVVGAGSDYRYRVSVPREIFAEVLLSRVSAIDYPNFKESVRDSELAELYADFWGKHRAYQDS